MKPGGGSEFIRVMEARRSMFGMEETEVDVSVRVRALFCCVAVGLEGILPERYGDVGDSGGKVAGLGAKGVSDGIVLG
jgi:hypothetical protein